MEIRFNGEATMIDRAMPLSELLARMEDLPQNFAVAVNEAFVPREAYADTPLNEGDEVELLVPMQGG